jgi:uncharacterized repeat protein (TIGR01451 family)
MDRKALARQSHRLGRGLGLPLSIVIGLLAAALLLLAAAQAGSSPAQASALPGGTPKLILSTKSVTPTLTTPGTGVLIYTIRIVNTGASAAQGTTLVDSLPAAVTYVPDSLSSSGGSAQVQGNTLTWTGDIGFDSAVVVQFSAQLSSPFSGTVVNTAVISNSQIARPVVVSATTQVTNDPVLMVRKSSAPALPGPNKPMVYSLTVTNVGQAANNLPLVVSDHVPMNTTFLSPGAGGVYDAGNNDVNWTRPVTLGVGESTVLTYSVTVGPVVTGTVLTNDRYGIFGPSNVITTGPVHTVTVIKPSFLLYKQSEPDPPGSNREMTYTLTVLNMGSQATGLVVSDTVPAGVTYVRGGTPAGSTVTWGLASLDSGATANFTYTVAVPDVAGVQVANTNYQVCSAEGVCQAGVPLTSTVNGPNFRVTASINPIAKKPGGGSGPATTVTPTLVLRNLGPGNAIDAQATLYFTRISVSANDLYVTPAVGTSPPFPDGPLCGDNCVSYVWRGSLAAGQVVTFTTIDGQSTIGGEEGTIYTATLVVTDTLSNLVTAPITGTATGKVTHFANIIPAKSAPTVIGRGQLLTYTFDVMNAGLTVESPPVLTDTLPLSTTFVYASNGGIAQSVGARTVVSWTLPVLSTGDTTQLTLTVRVADNVISGTKIINNLYRVSWTESETSTLLYNLGTPVTTTVKEVGLIDSFKEVTPTSALPSPGNLLTYVVHVVNSSALPLTGVSLDDTLPWQPTTYQRDATASAGALVSDIVSLHWSGDVAAFSSQLVTFTVLVDPDYEGPVTNTAVISHTGLLAPVVTTATAYVTTRPVLFISKTASPDPVALGDELVYTLRLQNLGRPATSLVITDAIPANTQYLPGSASANGQAAGGQIRWDLLGLGAQDVRTLTYRVTVLSGRQVINECYRISSAEGVSAVGAPVITTVAGNPNIYLPLVSR